MTIYFLDANRGNPGSGPNFAGTLCGTFPTVGANENYAPLGCEGAVTCDTGVELLYRIAGRR